MLSEAPQRYTEEERQDLAELAGGLRERIDQAE